MKIYTKTGDGGETGLFAGGRVSKDHARLHAYGTVDELNAILGIVLACGIDGPLYSAIQRVQSELFIVGADLATPLDAKTKFVERVSSESVARLEAEIDRWDADLPPLTSFILPGGGMAGAFLHQARTVCRRAERWVVTLQRLEAVNDVVVCFLNRLSDWLFVISRVANLNDGADETHWKSQRE